MPGAQQIDQPVHGRSLGVGGRSTGGAAGTHVGTVHVPLEVADVVVGQQPIEPRQDGLERVRTGEVEHQLVTAEHGLVARCLQHPVGMFAVQVAVGADHLGLDPQAELQPEPAYVVDQRGEPVGVDVGRHPPVAERRGVVAAAGEPAVVEHEPFGAHERGAIGQRAQASEIVVEVHRFPGVDQHRSRPRRMRGQGAGVAMEASARPGEPVRRIGAEHVGCRIRLARLEHDLARAEQFADAGRAPTIGEPLDTEVGVAAPRQMDAPHLATSFREPGVADPGQGGMFVRGDSRPVLHVDGARRQRLAMRVELAAPAPVERDHLGGVGGQRDGHVQTAECVGRVAHVGHRRTDPEHSARVQFDPGLEFEPGHLVTAHCDDPIGSNGGRDGCEPWRPSAPIVAMALETGSGHEA